MNEFLSSCSHDLETLIFEDYNSVDDGGHLTAYDKLIRKFSIHRKFAKKL